MVGHKKKGPVYMSSTSEAIDGTTTGLDLRNDFSIAVEALGMMGWGWNYPEQERIPTLSRIQEGVANSGNLEAWLADRAGVGIRDPLLIIPRVGRPGIGISDLVRSIDPDAFPLGRVRYNFWGYPGSDRSPNNYNPIHDNAAEIPFVGAWDVAFLLGDKEDPASGEEPYDEGLVFTKMNVDEQRAAAKAESAILENRFGIRVVTATAAAIGVDHLVSKVLGEKRRGLTRLIHHPDEECAPFRNTNGSNEMTMHIPAINQGGDQLSWSHAYTNRGWSHDGVRRMVRVVMPSVVPEELQ